ncbi:MAG: glycosyltransferase family 4 protein [Dongiaceae bacterium]
MRVLFLHNNFPAQFKHVAAALAADKNNQIVGASFDNKKTLPGVSRVYYKASREASKETHHYLRNTELAVLEAQGVFRSLSDLRKKGFVPDVVCGHSGWGCTLYVKDLFPEARQLSYFEWFYHARDSDVDFFSRGKVSYDDMCRVRTRNIPIIMDLVNCDWGICPTEFQASKIPPLFHPKISVMHDGIDTDFFKPNPAAKLVFPNINLDLSGADEILTYATRGMEPYRGFPQFMHAVALLQKRRPNLQTVVVGTDRVAYGKKLPQGQSYKKKLLDELRDIDQSRLHFTGHLPYDDYLRVLQASSVHVYMTIPFVLSWSLLESLAAGCLIVASDTDPIREVMEDGKNGLLVDFFSPSQLADRIEEALDHRDRYAALRKAARETIVERYALNDLLPKHVKLLEDLAAGRTPSAPLAAQSAVQSAAEPAVAAAAIQMPPVRKKSRRPKNLPKARRR